MSEKINWYSGVAVISLLVGIFAILRIGLNIALYPSYPSFGALPFNMYTVPMYTQSESDCSSLTPYPSSPTDPAYNPELQAVQTQYDRENCLKTVRQQSTQTQYVDMTLAGFFTFLGLGMLLSKKFLSKIF